MRLFLLIPALLAGCSSAPLAPPDAGLALDAAPITDAASADLGFSPDAASTDAIAAADAASPEDAAVAPDAAAIDGSLAGTPLAGLPLSFTAPLELCDVWQEGGTLAEGRARQIHLRLPEQPRPSLEPGALGAARFNRGVVEIDPYTPGVWIVDTETTASSLSEWTLSGSAADAHLRATVVHALGGAGLLYEQLDVERMTGDRRPVDYAALQEVTFRFVQSNGTASFLGPCGGEANLETAVVVAAFTSGADSVTVLREERTRLAPAGSAPLYPIRAAVELRSGTTMTVQDASSFFAQTYTAQHHNWDERSQIDFTRDRRWSFLVFEPLARGEQPTYPPLAIAKAQVIGLGTQGNPNARIELDLVELPGGVHRMTQYAAANDWRRVDAAQIARELQAACPMPEIHSYQDFNSTILGSLVLAGCPGAGPLGFDVRMLIPVLFPGSPTDSGARFTAIRPLGAGIEVEVGSYRYEIVRGGFSLQLHAFQGGTDLGNTPAYETPLFEDRPRDSRSEATSADGSVVAAIEQAWLFQGAGSSSILGPLGFELTFGGRTQRVRAWDKMVYTNTHHNWDDRLVAETNELRLFWTVMGFGGAVQVRAERISDGQEVLPPTDLTR